MSITEVKSQLVPAATAPKKITNRTTLTLKQSLSTLSGLLTALSMCGTTAAGLVTLLHSTAASGDLAIGGAALTLAMAAVHYVTQDVPGA